VADSAGLLNRCTGKTVPGVQIPSSPLTSDNGRSRETFRLRLPASPIISFPPVPMNRIHPSGRLSPWRIGASPEKAIRVKDLLCAKSPRLLAYWRSRSRQCVSDDAAHASLLLNTSATTTEEPPRRCTRPRWRRPQRRRARSTATP
jgi:hypothetical protein